MIGSKQGGVKGCSNVQGVIPANQMFSSVAKAAATGDMVQHSAILMQGQPCTESVALQRQLLLGVVHRWMRQAQMCCAFCQQA